MLFSLDIIIYLSFNICIVKIMFHLIDATKWTGITVYTMDMKMSRNKGEKTEKILLIIFISQVFWSASVLFLIPVLHFNKD